MNTHLSRTRKNFTEREHNMQSLDALTSLLKSHPFLAGLTPEFYEFFHRHATIRRFASQQQIFHEGGEADHFYLVLFRRSCFGHPCPGLRDSDDSAPRPAGSTRLVLALSSVPVALHRHDARADGSHFFQRRGSSG